MPAPLEHKPFGEPPRQERAAEQLALAVPGFLDAVLSLPPASRGPRPILMVAHGAGDRPEWQCEWWASVVGERAVILCLRGKAMYPRRRDTGYYYPNHHALEREALAALGALREAHAERIAAGDVLYAGFSQGAIMGALFTAQHPELFRNLILIEGGYDEWDVRSAQKLAAGREARVLFACGQSYCASHARSSMQWLRRGGVEPRLELAPRAGHTYAGAVGERVIASFEWVVEHDARWRKSRAPIQRVGAELSRRAPAGGGEKCPTSPVVAAPTQHSARSRPDLVFVSLRGPLA